MKKFAKVSNKPLHQAMIELRRSGAAGLHADRRLRRLHSRAAQKQAAFHDQQK